MSDFAEFMQYEGVHLCITKVAVDHPDKAIRSEFALIIMGVSKGKATRENPPIEITYSPYCLKIERFHGLKSMLNSGDRDYLFYRGMPKFDG